MNNAVRQFSQVMKTKVHHDFIILQYFHIIPTDFDSSYAHI